MTVQIGDIVRAVVSYSAPNSSVAQSVFYFELTGGTESDQNVHDAISAALVANWLAEWDNVGSTLAEAFLIETDIINGDGTVDRDLSSDEISVFGTVVGQLLASATSAYLQADSERGKSKGKKYIPFLTEVALADSKWVAGTMTVIAAMLVDYLNPIAVAGPAILLPGVLSRVTQTFQQFLGTGYTVDIPAYQRRRKINVGS